MATTDPLYNTHKSISLPSFSTKVYTITGIKCTVFGLNELPSDVQDISCLWLLHPRLSTQERMVAMANQALANWHDKSELAKKGKGLICVAFDQRNHGTRIVDPLANESWREKNPRHAQDMFGTYQGTAQDCSLLITHLPSYLPLSVPSPTQHLVLGVSLGAHSAWHNILHDKRVHAAVIIVGCPDFSRLMAQRASKSKISDWTSSSPAGSSFFGSASFPDSLIGAIDMSDPAGALLPLGAKATSLPPLQTPNKASLVPPSKPRAVAQLNRMLKGKAILNLSGGADKLVPYACSAPFMEFLKGATDSKEGWWREGGLLVVDKVFPGVKHETSPEMAKIAVEFVGDVVEGKIPVGEGVKSRI